jgi:phosphoribosyl 1,2-cyclic phosphodiesterase
MVTDVINLGSGSKGNAYFLNIKRKLDYGFTDDELGESFGLLIECGLPFDTLSKRLREQSKGKYSMVDVKAVLVTHRHGDHSLAVKELLDLGKVVYAPISVFEHYNIDVNSLKYKGVAIAVNEMVKKYIAPKIAITPFPLEHDEKKNMLHSDKELLTKVVDYNESDYLIVFGFIISIGSDYNVLFFIDTMFMPFNLDKTGIKFNMIFGEANHFHQPTYMAYVNAVNDMNYANIKRYERIIYSHMNVETFVKTLNGLDLSKCERIFAMHTSSSNRVTGDEIKYYQYIKNNIKPYHHKDLKILVCKEQGNFTTGGL